MTYAPELSYEIEFKPEHLDQSSDMYLYQNGMVTLKCSDIDEARVAFQDMMNNYGICIDVETGQQEDGDPMITQLSIYEVAGNQRKVICGWNLGDKNTDAPDVLEEITRVAA